MGVNVRVGAVAAVFLTSVHFIIAVTARGSAAWLEKKLIQSNKPAAWSSIQVKVVGTFIQAYAIQM